MLALLIILWRERLATVPVSLLEDDDGDVPWLERLNISVEGGSEGMLMIGRLFALNNFWSSTLKVPGFTSLR